MKDNQNNSTLDLEAVEAEINAEKDTMDMRTRRGKAGHRTKSKQRYRCT